MKVTTLDPEITSLALPSKAGDPVWELALSTRVKANGPKANTWL